MLIFGLLAKNSANRLPLESVTMSALLRIVIVNKWTIFNVYTPLPEESFDVAIVMPNGIRLLDLCAYNNKSHPAAERFV